MRCTAFKSVEEMLIQSVQDAILWDDSIIDAWSTCQMDDYARDVVSKAEARNLDRATWLRSRGRKSYNLPKTTPISIAEIFNK